MIIFKNLSDWIVERRNMNTSLGFIPTMGALHDGHIELVRQAKERCDKVIVSIFLNPTQFNNPADLENYPSQLQSDIEKLEAIGVDYLLTPGFESIYPDQYNFKVVEMNLSQKLCGAHRPGHFDGVLTVVMKLFNIVKPNKAYFGEKDFQQLSLIKGMVDAFFMDVEIIPVPTQRDKSGLAKSSRNLRLTPKELELAPRLYKGLTEFKEKNKALDYLSNQGFKIEYLEDLDGRRYVAAHLGNVRLIDNVQI